MKTQGRNLKILIVAAEVFPFAKTGGLADVAGALPKALAKLGHDVRVMMPGYGIIDKNRFNMTKILNPFSVPWDDHQEMVSLYRSSIDENVPAYFLANSKYFDREGIYGYLDDDQRFILFCRGALESLKQLDWKPDVIHCNDWHTALIPNYLKTIYSKDPFYSQITTVLTIHNLAYQGVYGRRCLACSGLEQYGWLYPHIQELGEQFHFLGRGIYYADATNTVSKTYADEIRTPEYGENLDSLLREHSDKLFGILNGIDVDEYDPKRDKEIARNFDANSVEKKIENKLALQKECRLPVSKETPLVGIISRLYDQKGFDLIANAMPGLSLLDFQLVVLGTGDQHYHHLFQRLASNQPEKACVHLTFNAALAKRIYAGSDMFLMPSRFEPCGLGQMIALRYGSIPVVRSTGGLADTVFDYDPITGEGNGFAFKPYDHWMLFATMVRAFEQYKNRDQWTSLVRKAMLEDHSWEHSAKEYLDLYKKAAEFRAKTPVKT